MDVAGNEVATMSGPIDVSSTQSEQIGLLDIKVLALATDVNLVDGMVKAVLSKVTAQSLENGQQSAQIGQQSEQIGKLLELMESMQSTIDGLSDGQSCMTAVVDGRRGVRMAEPLSDP